MAKCQVKERYYCLVSVAGTKFSQKLVGAYLNWADEREARIDFILLDYPERLNVAAFDGSSAMESLAIAKSRGRQKIKDLQLPGNLIRSWSEMELEVGIAARLSRIDAAFHENPSFRRHCLSQTFSNLRPVFRRLGVKDKKHELVHRAAGYLMEELALKVALFEEGTYSGEILPSPEMGLIRQVYSGAYFRCHRSNRQFLLIVHDGISFTEESVN